jgi:hypothetical protein
MQFWKWLENAKKNYGVDFTNCSGNVKNLLIELKHEGITLNIDGLCYYRNEVLNRICRKTFEEAKETIKAIQTIENEIFKGVALPIKNRYYVIVQSNGCAKEYCSIWDAEQFFKHSGQHIPEDYKVIQVA